MKKIIVCILFIVFFTASIFAEDDDFFPGVSFNIHAGPVFSSMENPYGVLWKINVGIHPPEQHGIMNIGIMYGTGNALTSREGDKTIYYGLFKDNFYLEDSIYYPVMKEVKSTFYAIEGLLGVYFAVPESKFVVSIKSGLVYFYASLEGKLLSDVVEVLGHMKGYSIPVSVEIKYTMFEIDGNKVCIYVEPEIWLNLQHQLFLLINTNIGMEF